jgi:hypothetical protein
MPILNIADNIQQAEKQIEQLTQEIFRMQGVLQTFKSFESGGLKTIDLPNNPNQTPTEESAEDLESIQEKPE